MPPRLAPRPLPPRLGVEDREPGGVRLEGLELPERLLGRPFRSFAAEAVLAVPKSSCLRSSYLRCFSSRSLAAWACRSARVSSRCFRSSSSSEDSSFLLRSRFSSPSVGGLRDWMTGPFRERRTVGALNSDRRGTTLRDSRK
jgi:hypothetical protein